MGQDIEDQRQKRVVWLLAVGVFLLILAVRLGFVWGFGSPVPLLDQWDVEPGLYQAWDEGGLTLGQMMGRHNEHVLLTSRVFWLGVYVLSGVWDPIAQMAASAVVYAAFWGGLAWVLIGQARGYWEKALVAVLSAAIGAAPAGTINMLGGFQVPFYLSLLFQFLAIWLLVRFEPLTWRWWMGVAAATLALLSLGNGFIGPCVAGGIMMARGVVGWREGKVDWRGVLAGGGVVAVCGAALWLTMRAGGPAARGSVAAWDMVMAMCRLMSAPMQWTRWYWVVVWLPGIVYLGALGWRMVKGKVESNDWLMISLFGWVLLMALATVAARGPFTDGLPDYYIDNIMPGVLLNAAVVAAWGFNGGVKRQGVRMILVSVWSVGLMVVLGLVTWRAGVGLGMRTKHMWMMQENVAAYLAQGDERWLTQRGPVPYFVSPKRMKDLLDDAKIRALVPWDLTPDGIMAGGTKREDLWRAACAAAFLGMGMWVGAAAGIRRRVGDAPEESAAG